MQKVVIIGATSAIAESTARLYAARGAQLFLVARNAVRLKDIADDLRVRGAPEVFQATLDVNDVQDHARLIEQIWTSLGHVDVLLVAHGTLPDQARCEASVEWALREFGTNGASTIALLTAVAPRFETQRKGVIAVISSVAGDRGRQSNYLYGSAKAAVTAFASGLRQRMAKVGVNVITIKPGFVDTPMTRDFKKGALWARPDDIALGIAHAADRGRSVVYLPWFWLPIMLIIRHVPEFIFKRLKL
ncbi:Short-chain dehydrogenase [Dyella jiangningensis]|uniref:SDR family oxidoreductase n=1 Tax=Dyella sp. AtDHG13 TaxID=1938897 RepID=UPI00088552AD|nr:SDR family oxidoreductase [Dyella sp. AtDHG13]PXV57252.1 short-subunit dehydrogenase [Dyella sp. AtDHG13]SDK37048.1 Short-chain dehydrogenase [Dyella jiangningensis]